MANGRCVHLGVVPIEWQETVSSHLMRALFADLADITSDSILFSTNGLGLSESFLGINAAFVFFEESIKV